MCALFMHSHRGLQLHNSTESPPSATLSPGPGVHAALCVAKSSSFCKSPASMSLQMVIGSCKFQFVLMSSTCPFSSYLFSQVPVFLALPHSQLSFPSCWPADLIETSGPTADADAAALHGFLPQLPSNSLNKV